MDVIPKYRIPARVYMTGDPIPVLGVVFVRQEQRIIDMLCDPRPFFPINTKDGLLLINKQSVAKVSVVGREEARQSRDVFPEVDLHQLA